MGIHQQNCSWDIILSFIITISLFETGKRLKICRKDIRFGKMQTTLEMHNLTII